MSLHTDEGGVFIPPQAEYNGVCLESQHLGG